MDGRINYKTETRIEAARLFDAGFGYKWVSKELRLPQGTLRGWQDSHRQGRLLGLGSVTKNKKFATEVKIAAVEKFLSGAVKSEVLVEFNITTRAMLDKWVAIYRDQGSEGLTLKAKGRPKKGTGAALESDSEKILRLEMEVAVLKKLIALESRDQAALLAKRKQSGR